MAGSLLLIPSSAAADANHYIVDPGYTTHVRLQASDGYKVNVSAGNRPWVAIEVRKGGVMTEYRARGARYGKFGTMARFPEFGQVRFRFIANGRQHRVPPPAWCEGSAGLLLEGRILGRIRFAGEDRYTSVSVKRAKAEVQTWPRMRCRFFEPDGRRQARRWSATFYAFRETPPNIDFSVKRRSKQLRPVSKQVLFAVYTGSFEHGVSIYRSARVAADNSTFVVPDPKAAPENAIFRPPPPFSGTASFHRTPESVFTWEGDLSVQFPGVESLLLTGSNFDINYCAQGGCVQQDVADEVVIDGRRDEDPSSRGLTR